MTSWWFFFLSFPTPSVCDNSLLQRPPFFSLRDVSNFPLLASTVPNSPPRVRAYLSICVEPGSILRYPTETPCMWGCTHQETATEDDTPIWRYSRTMHVRGVVKSRRSRNNTVESLFFLFFNLEATRQYSSLYPRSTIASPRRRSQRSRQIIAESSARCQFSRVTLRARVRF